MLSVSVDALAFEYVFHFVTAEGLLAQEKIKYSYFLIINLNYLGEMLICQAALYSSKV